MIVILIIIGSIYFILLDELIMGSAQRRIGPFNVGWYGIPSSIINGRYLASVDRYVNLYLFIPYYNYLVPYFWC